MYDEIVSRIEFLGTPLEPHVPAFEIAGKIYTVLHPLVGLEVIGAAPSERPVAGDINAGGTSEAVLFFWGEYFGGGGAAYGEAVAWGK